MISVDCLLVIAIHVAANVEEATKILRKIWNPRKSFSVFRDGFCWNLESMVDIVRSLGRKKLRKQKLKKTGERDKEADANVTDR